MPSELDSTLSLAQQILDSESSLRGRAYGLSPTKRMLDLLIGSGSLPLVIPIIAIAGLKVWEQDHHWPFVDVGNNEATGKHVAEWKIRTMIPNANQKEAAVTNGLTLPQFKRSGLPDPRITQFGKRLRKTSLDEAPQMINVLCGHLSAVGPRLPLASDLRFLKEHQSEHPYQQFLKLAATDGFKFGVTGFYVLFGRTNLSDEIRYALETYYWNNQSFLGDLRIIAATIPALRKTSIQNQ